MMEKNGMLTLTEQDMEMYKEGQVSQKVKEAWDIEYEEMDQLVKAGSFQIVNENNSTSE